MRFTPNDVLLVLLMAMTACNARTGAVPNEGAASSNTRTTEAEPAAKPADVTIPVEGMSCPACAARLKRGLKSVDGVVDVDVSLEKSNARIRFLPAKTNPDQLAATIRGMDLTPGAPSPSSGP